MGREREILDWLKQRLPVGGGVAVGVGDDAAVLTPGDRGDLVTACDQVVEAVHFDADTPPALIGRKALGRNLSDLAAMGARPWVALAAVAWPDRRPTDELKQMFEGLMDCARENETQLVGGDLGRSPVGARVDVTVIGCLEGRRPLLRTGARVGDDLVVSGALGGSREGHHLTFTPRWREGILLAETGAVHAAIDISDGLALDLGRLLEANGLGARVEATALPRRTLAADRTASVEAALEDGEDFELLLAVAPEAWPRLNEHPSLAALPFTRIGRVTEGERLLAHADGRVTPLADGGYEHRFA